MSEPSDETSLIEGQDSEPADTPPPAQPPSDPGLVDELEDQERTGWLNEPTTG
jgi:hypothetical protein